MPTAGGKKIKTWKQKLKLELGFRVGIPSWESLELGRRSLMAFLGFAFGLLLEVGFWDLTPGSWLFSILWKGKKLLALLGFNSNFSSQGIQTLWGVSLGFSINSRFIFVVPPPANSSSWRGNSGR